MDVSLRKKTLDAGDGIAGAGLGPLLLGLGGMITPCVVNVVSGEKTVNPDELVDFVRKWYWIPGASSSMV